MYGVEIAETDWTICKTVQPGHVQACTVVYVQDEFEPRSSKTNDLKIDTYRFPARCSGLLG